MQAPAKVVEEINLLGPLEVKGSKLGAGAQGQRHQVGGGLWPVGIDWVEDGHCKTESWEIKFLYEYKGFRRRLKN